MLPDQARRRFCGVGPPKQRWMSPWTNRLLSLLVTECHQPAAHCEEIAKGQCSHSRLQHGAVCRRHTGVCLCPELYRFRGRGKSKDMNFDLQQTKALSSVLSLWLKERAYTSPALKYPYRSWADIQSQVALFRNQPYAAASRILRAWRHLGTEGVGTKRVARLMQIVRENCFRQGTDELLPANENRLRLEFVRSPKARALRQQYGSFPLEHRLRLRFPNDDDAERQGDLIILKPYNEATGERGVIMLMYSEAILATAAIYDLGAPASRYMFVIEPSWWGYQDARFLLYLGSDLDVLIQSPRRADFEFVADLETNLVPVRVGAGEWGDPSVFRPRAVGQEATYDVVMVAAWDPLKRHEVFFRAAVRFKH